MYQLTLTAAERKAIDWIGHRYRHGNDLYSLLWCECNSAPADADWNSNCDITFAIPEYAAWELNNIADDCEHRWDCFGPELVEKLEDFCMAIV